MLVDAFNYTVPSLLNQFLCDNAIIDKTLFYGILNFKPLVLLQIYSR
jgi:hypothetical protein